MVVGEDGDSLPGVVGPTGNAPVPNWYGEVRSNSIIQRSYQDGRKRRDCCLISRELVARTKRTLQVALVENKCFFLGSFSSLLRTEIRTEKKYTSTVLPPMCHVLCSVSWRFQRELHLKSNS